MTTHTTPRIWSFGTGERAEDSLSLCCSNKSTSVENYLVIIAASIPTLKPFFSRRKKPSTGYSSKLSDLSSAMRNRGRSRSARLGHDLDGFPLTSVGVSCLSVDGGASQKNLVTSARHSIEHHNAERDIIKTIDVSVDFNGRITR